MCSSDLILFLGRVGDRKGVPDLLCALGSSELRGLDWRATIAGDGDRGDADLERYRAMAAERHIGDRVSFPGWVDPGEVHRLLGDADVFVLPSHSENLPVALLEAMSAGLPIVATAVGAIPEAARPGREAVINEAGNVGALTEALAALLRDACLRSTLGRAALARYGAGYSVAAYAKSLLALYGDVLRERRLASPLHSDR